MTTEDTLAAPDGTTNGSQAPKQFTVAIAGGGIAGLVLTIGLLRQGVPVQLYEAAKAFSEIGAGIGFGPNAQQAMELINPAIKAGYLRRAMQNGSETHGRLMHYRYGMPPRNGKGKVGDLVHAVSWGNSEGKSVHRAAFLEELLKLVPEEVCHLGMRLEQVEETRGGVELVFANGERARASTVIGCDGVKSRVREILLGETKEGSPTFTGKYAYRGLVPMKDAIELLGEKLAIDTQLHMGYGAHVLTFPIEQGSIMNVVAFHTKDDWKWDDEEWIKPMNKEHMLDDYKDWGANVKNILSLMQKPNLWALFDHPPASTYHRKGKILLLGDAAHASTPHQGAGAGMALEDAYILSTLLGMISEAKDLESVFEAYESVRRERTQKLVTTSREAGLVYEFQCQGIGDDPEKIRYNLDRRYQWIWDEDMSRQGDEARSFLAQRLQLDT